MHDPKVVARWKNALEHARKEGKQVVQAKRWANMDESELRLTVTKTDPRASGPPVIRRLEVF